MDAAEQVAELSAPELEVELADAPVSEPELQAESKPESNTGASEIEPAPEVGAGNLLSDDEVFQSVAALIYASPEPIGERRLASLLEGVELSRVRVAIETARERLAASGFPLELREIAGGFQILTAQALGATVARLFKARKAERISAAALETLAVIAYRQPVSKAEIEAIRGVQAGPILRSLVDRGLVRVVGRADVPGHPLQYGTTKTFLDHFGLANVEALPRDAELAKD
jgi:segregation and condensation protein B